MMKTLKLSLPSPFEGKCHVNALNRHVWTGTGARIATCSIALAGLLTAASEGPRYRRIDLDADVPNAALHTDPSLVNGWGLPISPSGWTWVADNGTASLSIYGPDG